MKVEGREQKPHPPELSTLNSQLSTLNCFDEGGVESGRSIWHHNEIKPASLRRHAADERTIHDHNPPAPLSRRRKVTEHATIAARGRASPIRTLPTSPEPIVAIDRKKLWISLNQIAPTGSYRINANRLLRAVLLREILAVLQRLMFLAADNCLLPS